MTTKAVFTRPDGADTDRPPTSIASQDALRDNLWGDRWFGCEHPERPWNVWLVFHDCCPVCLLSATAVEANGIQLPTGMLDTMADRLERFGPAPRSAVAS